VEIGLFLTITNLLKLSVRVFWGLVFLFICLVILVSLSKDVRIELTTCKLLVGGQMLQYYYFSTAITY